MFFSLEIKIGYLLANKNPTNKEVKDGMFCVQKRVQQIM